MIPSTTNKGSVDPFNELRPLIRILNFPEPGEPEAEFTTIPGAVP